MSGLVGYIGERNAKETILEGLKKLEYQGDSSGIAILGNGVAVYKEKGKIQDLEQSIQAEKLTGTAGIGHTRWATRGKPNRMNAHPHQSRSGRFVLVHNGMVQNDAELKKKYLPEVKLMSETDTEVIVQLVEYFQHQGMDVEKAFRRVLNELQGTFSLVLVDAQDPDTLYAAKNKSPLVLGIGHGHENMVASNTMAMIHVTNQFKDLRDKEYVILSRDAVEIKDFKGQKIDRQTYTVNWDASSTDKGNYEHFMLKEIDQQPTVLRNIIKEYRNKDGQLRAGDHLDHMHIPKRIYIVACGTSYHAGLAGKRLLEQVARIPTEVHIASEFLYGQPLIEADSLFVFISQSGETADSVGVFNNMKQLGHPTLAVTNVEGSTLYREADYTLLTHAGPEMAVASTKAYTAQVAVMAILSTYLAERQSLQTGLDVFYELQKVSRAMETLQGLKDQAKQIAHQFLKGGKSCFFIGRQLDHTVCLEGALKLKESSYIQAEGYAAGEFKHGPIALIEEGTPVFVLITDESTASIMRNNIQELDSRGANICVLAAEGISEPGDAWVLPKVHPLLTPLVTVIPLQLIAYYAALALGREVDKPRHLTKSVTME